MTSIMCQVHECKNNDNGICSCEVIGIEYTEAEGISLAYCQDYERKEVIYESHDYDYVKPKW